MNNISQYISGIGIFLLPITGIALAPKIPHRSGPSAYVGDQSQGKPCFYFLGCESYMLWGGGAGGCCCYVCPFTCRLLFIVWWLFFKINFYKFFNKLNIWKDKDKTKQISCQRSLNKKKKCTCTCQFIQETECPDMYSASKSAEGPVQTEEASPKKSTEHMSTIAQLKPIPDLWSLLPNTFYKRTPNLIELGKCIGQSVTDFLKIKTRSRVILSGDSDFHSIVWWLFNQISLFIVENGATLAQSADIIESISVWCVGNVLVWAENRKTLERFFWKGGSLNVTQVVLFLDSCGVVFV